MVRARTGRELHGVLVERRFIFGAAVKIGRAIASDGGEPARKFRDFAQRRQVRERLQEDVVDQVFGVSGRDAGEENAVNHSRIAGVEVPKSGAVTGLRGAHEGVVGRIGRRGHRKETGARGTKFEECGHVRTIERLCPIHHPVHERSRRG